MHQWEIEIRRNRCKRKHTNRLDIVGFFFVCMYTILYETKLLFGNRFTVNGWFWELNDFPISFSIHFAVECEWTKNIWSNLWEKNRLQWIHFTQNVWTSYVSQPKSDFCLCHIQSDWTFARLNMNPRYFSYPMHIQEKGGKEIHLFVCLVIVYISKPYAIIANSIQLGCHVNILPPTFWIREKRRPFGDSQVCSNTSFMFTIR